MWSIDPAPVATASLRGGSGIEPYLPLLEGGAEGQFLSDMRDYFYYSMIRSTGEQTTKPRTLDGKVPLSEIPHLMCALGSYPTQNEIDNIISEVKYSEVDETGEYRLSISFDQFVKLYAWMRWDPVGPSATTVP